MIQIQNLHKRFSKNKVLRGIDLVIDEPGITAILGPNGSGKSTLIKCMLGMVLPDKGNIFFQGEAIKRKWSYRQYIDYLPQIARFPENLRVQELINMVKELRIQEADDQKLIALFGLHEFLDKRLGHLSGGTRQKVNLVLAFMIDSPLIILDEPTAGLDPVAILALKQLIMEEKKKGKHILCTTHITSLVEEISDQVVFLLDGKIHFQGSLSQLKSQYGSPNLEKAIANILQRKKVVETRKINLKVISK